MGKKMKIILNCFSNSIVCMTQNLKNTSTAVLTTVSLCYTHTFCYYFIITRNANITFLWRIGTAQIRNENSCTVRTRKRQNQLFCLFSVVVVSCSQVSEQQCAH